VRLSSVALVILSLGLSGFPGLCGEPRMDYFAMERLLTSAQLSQEVREERAFELLEAATREKVRWGLGGVEDGEITSGNNLASTISQLCRSNGDPVRWRELVARRLEQEPPGQYRGVLSLCLALMGGRADVSGIALLVESRENRPLCLVAMYGLRSVGTLECVQILRKIADGEDTATLRYEDGNKRFYYPIREYATRMLGELGAPVNPCPVPTQGEVIKELLGLMDRNVSAAAVALGGLRTPEAKAALLAFIGAHEGAAHSPVVSEAKSQVKDMVRAEQEKKEIGEMQKGATRSWPRLW